MNQQSGLNVYTWVLIHEPCNLCLLTDGFPDPAGLLPAIGSSKSGQPCDPHRLMSDPPVDCSPKLKSKENFFFFFFSPSDGPCLFPQWSSWGKDSLQRTIQGCPGSPVLNGSCSRAEIVSPGSPINSKQGIYWQRWGSTGITLQECSTSWSFMNGIYLHICYVFVTFPSSLSYPLPVIAQQT